MQMQDLQVFLARRGWLFHSTVASSAVQELGSPRSSHLSAFGVPSVKLLLLLGARLKGGPGPPEFVRCCVWPVGTGVLRFDSKTPFGHTWWLTCQERPVCPFEFWVKLRRATDVENTMEFSSEELN